MRPAAPARLDPVGRFRSPRRSTTLRLALVAGLLLTGAGVLYTTGDRSPTGDRPPTAGPGHHPTAGGDPAGPGARRPGTPAPGTLDPAAPAAGTPDPGTAFPGPVPPVRPAAGGPERLPIPRGRVAVPVPLASPAGPALLRPGDRVDLLTIPAAGGDPARLAERAPVLAVDPGAATLLLALTPDQGRAVVSTPATTRFAVIIRR